VMRTSTRPVLLVRAPETGPARAPVKLTQIAVPLDGSAAAEAAVPVAIELARALDARVTLLRVEQFVYTMVTAEPIAYVPDLTEMDNHVANAAQEYLDGVRAQVASDVQVEVLLLRGAPVATLMDILAHDAVDLVVMTTHGRGGVRRLVLGSVADRLVRSGAPVLLVRPPATKGHAAAHQEALPAGVGETQGMQ
jgi:nucleotide-binding universal stress UspA family protein